MYDVVLEYAKAYNSYKETKDIDAKATMIYIRKTHPHIFGD